MIVIRLICTLNMKEIHLIKWKYFREVRAISQSFKRVAFQTAITQHVKVVSLISSTKSVDFLIVIRKSLLFFKKSKALKHKIPCRVFKHIKELVGLCINMAQHKHCHIINKHKLFQLCEIEAKAFLILSDINGISNFKLHEYTGAWIGNYTLINCYKMEYDKT